jgi:hypothetical protein
MSEDQGGPYKQFIILEEYRMAAIEAAANLSLNPYKMLSHEEIQAAPANVRQALASLFDLSSRAHSILYKLMEKDNGIDKDILYRISKLYHDAGMDLYGEKPF